MESPHASPKHGGNAGNESPTLLGNFPILDSNVYEPLETITATSTTTATTTTTTATAITISGNIPLITANADPRIRPNTSQQPKDLIGMSITNLTPPLGADNDEKEEKKRY